MTDKGCARTRPGQPLADNSGGVSTGDLKRPEKPVIILSLTWARVDRLGLHFRVGQTWTFLEVGWIPNREAFVPLVQGVLVGIYVGYLAHIGITVQDEDRGLGEHSGSDLTGSCAGADPGPCTAGFLAT
jgi:hypothetical protein